MTGKLIKYEIRSMVRQMGLLWAALPALALIWVLTNSISNKGMAMIADSTRPVQFIPMIQTITTFVYVAVFAIMIVATVVIILQRFYKGLLRDEGYLMHTLPVKPWQLITSKGVVAFMVVLVSGIVAMISICILLMTGASISDVFHVIGELFSQLWKEPIYFLYIIEVILILIFGILKSIYQAYAAMAIGQTASNHKLLMSGVAFIGISVILSVLTSLLTMPIDESFMNAASEFFRGLGNFATIQTVFLIVLLIEGVQLAAFHFITERLLTKKLNLE